VEGFALTPAEQALFRALVARRVRFMIFSNASSVSPEPLALVNAAPNICDLFAVDNSFVYGTGSDGQIVGVAKDALGQ